VLLHTAQACPCSSLHEAAWRSLCFVVVHSSACAEHPVICGISSPCLTGTAPARPCSACLLPPGPSSGPSATGPALPIPACETYVAPKLINSQLLDLLPCRHVSYNLLQNTGFAGSL
jgi:hypothetical protein